jgi:hypothetical protein
MATKPEIASSIIDFDAFNVIEFLPRPSGSKADAPAFLPKVVQRKHDGLIFKIGDDVSNGGNYQGRQCRGKITGFDYLEDKIFVSHTWSGIGWNLGSLDHIIILPSENQIDDEVFFNLWSATVVGKIKAVHFYSGKVKYDLDVFPEKGGDTTRIYNIDSIFVSKTKK